MAVPALAAWCLACAKIEPPPGGPPDFTAPTLVATRPESLAQLPRFSGPVEFRFDEVISEGSSPSQGQGTGDLEKLVILSPTSRFPRVHWHRTRITVEPAEGWKAGRVYRVQLLPGVTDLKRNRSNEGTVLTFTTGAPLPDRTLEGLVVDWSTNRPAPQALVEAVLEPDSLPYRTLTDSSGRFSLGPIPNGEYLVRGVLDENHDTRAGPREAFDSVRAISRDTVTRVGELWTFVHDTTPPRIRTITVVDSVSATVELSQPLDPRQRLTVTAASLKHLPDSTPVKVSSIRPKPLDDSLTARARADTTRRDTSAVRDTTRKQRPGLRELPAGDTTRAAKADQPLTNRPQLSNQLVLRVPTPWTPEAKYELELKAVRSVSGVTGDAKGILAVPKREVRDTTKTPRDSLKGR